MSKTILVQGNTYPVRERLKELGGTWDAENKGWRFTDAEKAKEAQALVDKQPKKKSFSRPRYSGLCPHCGDDCGGGPGNCGYGFGGEY